MLVFLNPIKVLKMQFFYYAYDLEKPRIVLHFPNLIWVCETEWSTVSLQLASEPWFSKHVRTCLSCANSGFVGCFVYPIALGITYVHSMLWSSYNMIIIIVIVVEVVLFGLFLLLFRLVVSLIRGIGFLLSCKESFFFS